MATTGILMRWCGAASRRMSTAAAAVAVATSNQLGKGPSAIVCGRGDKKTKKGKRFKGTFGNSRPNKDKKMERFKDKIEVPRSTPWPPPFKLI